MPIRRLIVVVSLAACLVPAVARADCIGFFNQYEEGYKLEGDRLERSGTKIAAGVQLEFNGITQIKDRFFLTRARDDVMYDAQNIELTSGCDLPTRPPPHAH